MKIAAYSIDWESAYAYLRIIGPLEQAGFDLIKGGAPATESLVSEADLVFIGRDFPVHCPHLYERVMDLAKREMKVTVYDIDDALIEMEEEHEYFWEYGHKGMTIASAMMRASAITVTNRQLHEHYSAFNANCFIVPNYLNDFLWQRPPPSKATDQANNAVVIGYMGSSSHRRDLDEIRPVLERLLRKYKSDLKLRFWGVNPLSKIEAGELVQAEPWYPDYKEFAHKAYAFDCDLVVAPLKVNRFNYYKSNIKFLEYSYLSKPGVFSYAGPYNEVVIDRKNGMFACDQADWENALSELIENGRLRNSLAAAALETVESSWLLSSNGTTIRKQYEAIMQLPPDYFPDVARAFENLSIVYKEKIAKLEEARSLLTQNQAFASVRSRSLVEQHSEEIQRLRNLIDDKEHELSTQIRWNNKSKKLISAYRIQKQLGSRTPISRMRAIFSRPFS